MLLKRNLLCLRAIPDQLARQELTNDELLDIAATMADPRQVPAPLASRQVQCALCFLCGGSAVGVPYQERIGAV